MKNLFVSFFLLNLFACSSPVNSNSAGKMPFSGRDTCDDPDADINCCFVNAPRKLTYQMKILVDSGEKMIITGTVYHSDGCSPYSNVMIYAYHTDYKGLYSKAGNEKGFQRWHGKHHGWCKTDNSGRFEIHSIRPAPYPNNTMPAHIHAAIMKPDNSVYYINDFVFADDTLMDAKYLSSLQLIWGNGIVKLEKISGIWFGERNITLSKK